MRCREDLRFVYRPAIRSNVHAQACFGERLHEVPVAWSAGISFFFCEAAWDALDCTGSRTGPEPLPDLDSELLADEGHPVDAERTQWRGVVEEPGDDLDVGSVVGRVDRMWWLAPVCLYVSVMHGRHPIEEDVKKKGRRTATEMDVYQSVCEQ